jgi:hypothetical protein
MNNTKLDYQTKLDQNTLEIYSIVYGIDNKYNNIINYQDEIACAYIV